MFKYKLLLLGIILSIFKPRLVYSEIVEFPIDIEIINTRHEITAYLDDENPNYWAIDKGEFLALVQKYINVDKLSLVSEIVSDTLVESEDLLSLGWVSKYREDELLIIVKIPLQDREVMDIVLSQQRSKTPPSNLPKAEPHVFSGVINSYITHTHNFTDTDYYYDAIALRAAVAIGPFTFEDGHTYYQNSNGGASGWQRDKTRLLFDVPNGLGLIQIGDYSIETKINSLSSGDIFGVSYSYQPSYFSLSSRPNTIPIQLETNSTVNIRINGKDYRTIRLAPGRYNLKDLPLSGGVNIVEVTYIDQGGKEQTRFYNLIDHPELLNKGDIETQWVTGVFQEYNDEGVKEIIPDRTGAQMVSSYGLTDWWTVSSLVEWEEQGHKVKLGQSFSIGDDFLSVEADYSKGSSMEIIAYDSQYYLPFFLWDTLSNSSFNYSFSNNQFTGFSTQYVGFSSGLNLPITNGYVSFGVGSTFQEESDDVYIANINTSYQLWERVTVNVNLRSKWSAEVEEYDAYISLSIPLNYNGISLYGRSSYDSSINEQNNEISASKYDKDYNWRATAKFVENKYDSADVYAKVNGEEVNVFGRLTSKKESSKNPARVGTFGLETGIAWAGTDIHWTSPIGSSFTIVSLSDDFDGYGLQKGDYGRLTIVSNEVESAQSALLPVTDRNYRQINVDSLGLDFNEELSESSFVALGGIRSGSAYKLSILKGYFVTGQLYGENDKHFGEVVGEFIEKNTAKNYPFFTDNKGSFELDMVPNGEYRIRLFESSYKADSVTITSEYAIDDTFIELGEITLKK